MPIHGMPQFLSFFVNLWLGSLSDLKPTDVPLFITDPTITFTPWKLLFIVDPICLAIASSVSLTRSVSTGL